MSTLDQLEQIIPPERLELLDRLTLFNGSHHGGTGGPDCQHCARELLHEVVTGKHADCTPPGVTRFADILPPCNDGPWRDDAHRTEVMRPYLPKFLPPAFGGLDPANDERRVYALIDHTYRNIAPKLLDLLDLKDEAAKLRALAPIVDLKSAQTAIKEGATALARARARALAIDLDRALAIALDLDRAIATALDLDLDLDRAIATALDLDLDLDRAIATALDLDLDLDLDRAIATALALARGKEERAIAWERSVRGLLDTICSIP